MIYGAQVVEAARALVGIPFVHQGRNEHGLDCAGVLAAVAIPLGLATESMDRKDYQHLPTAKDLISRLELFCCETGKSLAMVPGAVLVFSFAGEARHAGWSTGTTVIHAYSPSGKVVEHPIAGRWKNRLDSVWIPMELKIG